MDDDEIDSQANNDADENSMDDPEAESKQIYLEEDDLDDFDGFNCTSLENPEGLILNTFPRFGELAMKMPRLPLMSPPKLLFKKIIQFYPEIIPQMTGC